VALGFTDGTEPFLGVSFREEEQERAAAALGKKAARVRLEARFGERGKGSGAGGGAGTCGQVGAAAPFLPKKKNRAWWMAGSAG
jgi:hypothetical protein